MRLLLDHRAHASAEETAAFAPISAVRDEVEVAGAFIIPRRLRGRPIVAIAAGEVESVVQAVARRRQKNRAAAWAGEQTAIDTVHRCPCVCTVVDQLLDLVR